MVERVARERLKGDRYAVVVHEEPDLHDGLLPVFLADAHLAEPPDDFPVRVNRVGVGIRYLEEEVGHVIEDRRRVAPDPARDARVHASDDLLRIVVDHRQRVVDVVVVRTRDDGAEVIVALPHCRHLRGRFENPPVCQHPHDALQVVTYLRRELDAGEELVKTERREDWVEDARRETLRFAKTRFVPGREGDRQLLPGCAVDEWLQLRNQRFAAPERLTQPPEVVGLAVIMLSQRPEREKLHLGRWLPAVLARAPPRHDQPEVDMTADRELLDVHPRLLCCFAPTP